MSEEKKQILQMLSDGKVNVDEAERLLAALEDSPAAPPAKPAGSPKFLRVEVQGNGNEAVNVRVPIQLIRAGMKFHHLIPEHAGDKLKQHGIDIEGFKGGDLDELVKALTELKVDVNDGDQKVRVFCE